MNDYLDNEVFEFSGEEEQNENMQQYNTDFNYNSISGLGESDYENEDLFSEEVKNDEVNDEVISINDNNEKETDDNIFNNVEYLIDNQFNDDNNSYNNEISSIEPIENNNYNDEVETNNLDVKTNDLNELEPETEEITTQDNVSTEETIEEQVETDTEKVEEEPLEDIEMSSTPIEELNKLTEYEEEKIESTDINALFDKVNVNVKEASDIFRKNSEMKEKIDSRFEELKNLQADIERTKKSQIEEIDNYKAEVLAKLNEKKEEIEKRLNTLKEVQSSLEKEKKEFEEYKKEEQEKIDQIQKDVQTAYDDRREELNHIEDVLRKQKDALDEERNQLSLDRIQYESDKNELANNLLKFNELVDSFTSGVNEVKNEQE